jgi:hypothetical protein
MATTYTLTTSVNIGTLLNPVAVSSLQVTNIAIATTPKLGVLGTGTLSLTLTDPASGAQEVITYNDASVLDLWALIEAAVSQAVFAKLLSDGKLPQGSIDSADASAVSSTMQTLETAEAEPEQTSVENKISTP